MYPVPRPRGFDPLHYLARYFDLIEINSTYYGPATNTPEFPGWLADWGIGFVNLDQPLFSKSIRPSAHVTSAAGYVRMHGRNYSDWFRKNAGRDARYDYMYEPA